MKNLVRRSFPVILVVVSLLAVISALACSGGSGYGNAPTTTSSVAAATGNSVTLASFAFSPATITVKVGTTVTWTNQDSTTHTITSDSGVWDSGNIAQNGTYTYAFSKAGTFPYHCSIHTYMKGTVIVQ